MTRPSFFYKVRPYKFFPTLDLSGARKVDYLDQI